MRNRWLRLVLLISITLFLGFWLARTMFFADGDFLRQAHESYARAEASLQSGDTSTAIQSLDEVDRLLLQSGKQLDRAAARKPAPTAELRAEHRTWKGELYWLKARSMRERAFARAALDGKPLPDMLDSTTGDMVRSWTAIPIDADRRQAITLLRSAAELLPENEKVLTDAMRTELMLSPISWQIVQPLAQAIVKVHPGDTRALYLLARYDFEQPPAIGPNQGTPREKRSAVRVAKSLEYLQELKKAKQYPLWRTLYLEAQAQTWRYDDARRRKDEPGARKARAALDDLYSGSSGAMMRLRAGDGLGAMSGWDIDGVLELPLLALDLRLREGATPGSAGVVLKVVQDFTEFCVKQAGKKAADVPLERMLGQLLAVLARSHTVLNRDLPEDWVALLENLNAQLTPALQRDAIPPAAVAQFADLLQLEARRQEIARRPAKAVALRADAKRWLNEGLRAADARKLTPAQQVPLHASAAYLKLSANGAPADHAAHLGALNNACLLDSLALLRAGSLEKALHTLDAGQRALTADQVTQAQVLQVEICLGLRNFHRSLPPLRQLDQAYVDGPKLALAEQLWLLDFAPRRDMLTLLLAVCHLEIARDKRARFSTQNPGAPLPADFLQLHEQEADTLARTLTAEGPYRCWFLQEKARYGKIVGLTEASAQAMNELQRVPAFRLAALSAELDRVLAKDALPLETHLQAFLLKNQADRSARLVLAVLLANSDRTPAALSTLAQAPGDAALPGDQLLPEHLDTLRALYTQMQRPDLGPEMLALFTSAEQRYRNDPRVVFGLGQALALKKDAAAARVLARALELARSPSTLLPPAKRAQLTIAIETALRSWATSAK